MSIEKDRYEFGKNLLGPVIADYLYRLLVNLRSFERERSAHTLFVSRAGIRIRRLAEIFSEVSGLPMPRGQDDFWISRLMVTKGGWNKNKLGSIRLLEQEFQNSTIRELIAGIFRYEGIPKNINQNHSDLDEPARDLESFFQRGGNAAREVESYLSEQASLFEDYLAQLLDKKETIVLVDSGWQGTGQRLLAESFADYDWWGVYFGRIGFASTDRTYWKKVIGLVFEADAFDPEKPETCVINNRHMIESLFEPHANSIERFIRESDGRVVAPESKSILGEAPDIDKDPVFCGVLDYITDLAECCSIYEIRKQAHIAWRELMEFTIMPSKTDAEIYYEIKRSADFGRELEVPLLLAPSKRFNGDSPQKRVKDSLWQAGQIALEYPSEIARPLQLKVAALDRGWLNELNDVDEKETSDSEVDRPLVAIITRTLDRPMFLKRAIESVASQSFSNFVHVIVNDGGDADVAKSTIEKSQCDKSRIILVNNNKNQGMEAASNIGIRAVDSKYIVIHDDDDSWEPGFLKTTVEYLECENSDIYGGVITKTSYVSEEVTADGIKVHGSTPYQAWVDSVHIMEMAIGNFFAPICFVFRRDVYDKIGGFDERYPVLGDWDFNLRYLLDSDIGVIPEFLANYHHRDKGDTTLFGNTVIAGRDKHLEYSAVVRNKFARNLLHSDHPAIANLVGMGLHFGAQRDLLRSVYESTKRLGGINEVPGSTEFIKLDGGEGSVSYDDLWVVFQKLVRIVTKSKLSIVSLFKLHKLLTRSGSNPRIAVTKMAKASFGPDFDILPPDDFAEDKYLEMYEDVKKAVQLDQFSSGYEHYIRFGRAEGRARP